MSEHNSNGLTVEEIRERLSQPGCTNCAVLRAAESFIRHSSGIGAEQTGLQKRLLEIADIMEDLNL